MRENLSRHMNRYLCEDLKAFEANCLSNDSVQRAAASAASTSVLTYLHLEDALDSLNAPRTDLPAIVDGTPNGLSPSFFSAVNKRFHPGLTLSDIAKLPDSTRVCGHPYV
ncbi:hypothetical protein PGQ11_011494 [Apiospora arundinis]|uniref:Uncharacterized protein n=1 Tax=Apiospora arundinis TaxID=335852 RepID=A0ABR2I0B5_9PEZI